jgi:hypothetical protein
MASAFEAYDPEVSRPFLREKYPRLRNEESKVLKAYLAETDPETVKRLRTAVPVGEGEVEGVPESQFEAARKAQTQLKIDAVVDRGAQQEIVELKSRATHTAAGQVIVYDLLLGQRDDEPTQSRLVVAAFRSQPDFQRVVRKLPVTLHTVPQADPSTATQRFMQDVGRTLGEEEG